MDERAKISEQAAKDIAQAWADACETKFRDGKLACWTPAEIKDIPIYASNWLHSFVWDALVDSRLELASLRTRNSELEEGIKELVGEFTAFERGNAGEGNISQAEIWGICARTLESLLPPVSAIKAPDTKEENDKP